MKKIKQNRKASARKPYARPLAAVFPLEGGCMMAGSGDQSLSKLVDVPALKGANPEDARIGRDHGREDANPFRDGGTTWPSCGSQDVADSWSAY